LIFSPPFFFAIFIFIFIFIIIFRFRWLFFQFFRYFSFFFHFHFRSFSIHAELFSSRFIFAQRVIRQRLASRGAAMALCAHGTPRDATRVHGARRVKGAPR